MTFHLSLLTVQSGGDDALCDLYHRGRVGHSGLDHVTQLPPPEDDYDDNNDKILLKKGCELELIPYSVHLTSSLPECLHFKLEDVSVGHQAAVHPVPASHHQHPVVQAQAPGDELFI